MAAGIKGVGVNTIAKDLAVLKTWMKNAFQREVYDNRKWETDAFKPREVKVTKPHLTLDEVKQLETFKIPKKVHNNGDERSRHGIPCAIGSSFRVLDGGACVGPPTIP